MVVDCMSSVYTYLFAIGIVSRTGIKYLVIPKWLKKKVIKDCVVIKKIFLVFPDNIYINMVKVESFKCICICLVLNLLLFVQCLLVHRSHWLLQDSKQGSEIPFFSWFHLFFFLILSSHFMQVAMQDTWSSVHSCLLNVVLNLFANCLYFDS